MYRIKEVVGNKILWVTPGGGIKEHETGKEALARELAEELGLKVMTKGEPMIQLDVLIEGKKGAFISREAYYKIQIESSSLLTFAGMTETEKETFKGLRGWKKSALSQLDNFASPEILSYL